MSSPARLSILEPSFAEPVEDPLGFAARVDLVVGAPLDERPPAARPGVHQVVAAVGLASLDCPAVTAPDGAVLAVELDRGLGGHAVCISRSGCASVFIFAILQF